MTDYPPKEYVFFMGGYHYKKNRVKKISEVRKEGKDIVYFDVNGTEVRLEVEEIMPKKYTRNFTCTHKQCTMFSFHHDQVCSHVIACIVWYSINLAFRS